MYRVLLKVVSDILICWNADSRCIGSRKRMEGRAIFVKDCLTEELIQQSYLGSHGH